MSEEQREIESLRVHIRNLENMIGYRFYVQVPVNTREQADKLAETLGNQSYGDVKVLQVVYGQGSEE